MNWFTTGNFTNNLPNFPKPLNPFCNGPDWFFWGEWVDLYIGAWDVHIWQGKDVMQGMAV